MTLTPPPPPPFFSTAYWRHTPLTMLELLSFLRAQDGFELVGVKRGVKVGTARIHLGLRHRAANEPCVEQIKGSIRDDDDDIGKQMSVKRLGCGVVVSSATDRASLSLSPSAASAGSAASARRTMQSCSPHAAALSAAGGESIPAIWAAVGGPGVCLAKRCTAFPLPPSKWKRTTYPNDEVCPP